jgi:hypothetical protein
MRISAIAILFVFFGLACKPEKKVFDKPENLISVEEMTQIMVQMQLIESYRQRAVLVPPHHDLEKETTVLTKRVFETFDVSQKQFNDSYTYYTLHPGILSDIYDGVLNELSQLQADLLEKSDSLNVGSPQNE